MAEVYRRERMLRPSVMLQPPLADDVLLLLDDLDQYHCVLIVTDHADYDYRRIVGEAQLIVDNKERDLRNRVFQYSWVLRPDLI